MHYIIHYKDTERNKAILLLFDVTRVQSANFKYDLEGYNTITSHKWQLSQNKNI
jgi:thiamine pyrophosphokinase